MDDDCVAVADSCSIVSVNKKSIADAFQSFVSDRGENGCSTAAVSSKKAQCVHHVCLLAINNDTRYFLPKPVPPLTEIYRQEIAGIIQDSKQRLIDAGFSSTYVKNHFELDSDEDKKLSEYLQETGVGGTYFLTWWMQVGDYRIPLGDRLTMQKEGHVDHTLFDPKDVSRLIVHDVQSVIPRTQAETALRSCIPDMVRDEVQLHFDDGLRSDDPLLGKLTMVGMTSKDCESSPFCVYREATVDLETGNIIGSCPQEKKESKPSLIE